MQSQNRAIAEVFREMASIYEFMGDKQKFRARAYDKAARVISNLMQGVDEFESISELEKIDGIGKSTAQKIFEYLDTGQVEKHEALKKKIPEDFIDLLEVSGFGPETLKTLHEELGLKTKKEIKKALKSGKVEEIKGFGKKKSENMLKGLKMAQKSNERIVLWQGLDIAAELLKKIRAMEGVKKAEIAGSIRRKKETIGDIDILVAAEKDKANAILKAFTEMNNVSEVIAHGDTKSSVVIRDKKRQVDLRLIEEEVWGAALFYFTGSKEHNVHIRKIAKKEGYKVSEYGLFDAKSEKRLTAKTEEGIYKKLGMHFIAPEMREDRGEIELAQKNQLPELVELADIKADMHMHSNWTDGNQSIEELAKHVKENFEYEFICLTDHSKAVTVAGGLDEQKVRKQLKAVKKVNDELGEKFIKTGIEVDIMADGSLDLSDELLSELDWVVASIHYKQNMEQTKRLIKACENPYVYVIGHPTGRLLNARDPYPVEMDEFLSAAKETNTALEINAHPRRSDLNDHWAAAAREKGIPLVINTDTHYLGNLEYMKNGIYVARRAWCEKDDILNTQSWQQISKFIKKKREAFVS